MNGTHTAKEITERRPHTGRIIVIPGDFELELPQEMWMSSKHTVCTHHRQLSQCIGTMNVEDGRSCMRRHGDRLDALLRWEGNGRMGMKTALCQLSIKVCQGNPISRIQRACVAGYDGV